jgi:cell division septal protein FtsQ
MAKYLRSKTGKVERKRRKAFLIRLYGGIFLGIVFVVLFFWLMQKPFFRVSDIAVRGLDTLDAEEIISIGKDNFDGKYLFLIPKDNILFYPKDKMENSLLSYDARIKNVEIKISKERLLMIDVEEHIPAYLYCDENCLYMNSGGYIYRDASGVPQEIYTVFRDKMGQVTLRENYTPEFWEEVKELLGFFHEKGMKIRMIEKTGEVDFIFHTNNDMAIKVDFDESEKTLQKYLDIFIDSNRELINSDSLEYIDARFGKKIFYKRNIENEGVSEELEI